MSRPDDDQGIERLADGNGLDWQPARGRPPRHATIRAGMHEFVEAMQAKNCDYDEPMEQSLLRKR